MARPSSLTEERRESIEQALAQGTPLSVAGAAGGVSPRSVSRWLQEGKLARRQLHAAPDPEPSVPGEELDLEKALVAIVLPAARNGSWQAALGLLRWREQRRRTPRWSGSWSSSSQASRPCAEEARTTSWSRPERGAR